MRLDYREKFPSGMEDYLSYNGWHFNKKMCDFATSNMYKKDGDKKKVYIKPFTRDDVDQLLSTHEIRLERNKGYDYVFVANMAKADYWCSSISDEMHLAKFIKDYIDDPDGYDGQPFNRWLSDIRGMHIPVDWSEFV